MGQRIVILGAGPGGYVAAIRAAQLGGDVTVVEKEEVGGTCLNRGCIPTKALVSSAEALELVRHARNYGVEVEGEVAYSLGAMMERKAKVVATQVKGILGLFKSHGVRLVRGTGRFKDARTVVVESGEGGPEEISADAVIVATGSRPAVIPAFPVDEERILSSDGALALEEIPETLLIVGAGVIGCEFAFILHALGARVTMVEMMPRAVPPADAEIAALLERELKKRKIKLHCGEKILGVEEGEDGLLVASLESGKRISAHKVLVSIGRTFNTDDLGLDRAGVATGPRGEIRVNERMETNVPGVYAVGDVVGGMMLAHEASAEGVVAVENALGRDRVMDYAVVPSAIFTMPEIGSVGLTEERAREAGAEVRVGRFPFRGLGKAHAMGEIVGLAKIVADARTDRILGVHVMGAHASDLVHEAAVLMRGGGTVRDMADTIHAHPTLSESLMEAAHAVHGECIHLPKEK